MLLHCPVHTAIRSWSCWSGTESESDENVEPEAVICFSKHPKQLELLVGDVFLGAACVAYYGPFTGLYR